MLNISSINRHLVDNFLIVVVDYIPPDEITLPGNPCFRLLFLSHCMSPTCKRFNCINVS